jgi:DNA polymerase-3 subunit epsilon
MRRWTISISVLGLQRKYTRPGSSRTAVNNAPCLTSITFVLFSPRNSAYFDLPFLVDEMLRIDQDLDLTHSRMVDVQAIFHKKEPRDLKAALRYYCGAELENAHSAAADARATCQILIEQLNRYPDLQGNVDFLHRFTARNNKSVDLAGRIVRDDKGIEVFGFGKYKGQSVEQVFGRDPSYYTWMMGGDFPRHTKKIITAIRLRGAASGTLS